MNILVVPLSRKYQKVSPKKPLVTVHTGAKTIQGRKLFAEIRIKS